MYHSVEHANENRDEKISDLKQMIDMLENNPELPIPDVFFYHAITVSEYVKDPETDEWGFVYDNEEIVKQYAKCQKALVKYDPEALQHIPDETLEDPFTEVKMDNGLVRYRVKVYRENACHKVKVGEKFVPEEPEKVIPAKPAHREPVYEYRCDPRLGKKVI